MTLECLNPSDELQLLLFVHGPENVPAAINFMEISRGTAEPGIQVYVTDMIELTDQIAATLVQADGVDLVTVTDKSVRDMREQVTTAVQAYVDANSDGVTLRRLLALSTLNSMPQEICVLAEELMVSLIILPFHKRQRADGTLDAGHSGFRYVNRKVIWIFTNPFKLFKRKLLIPSLITSFASLTPPTPDQNKKSIARTLMIAQGFQQVLRSAPCSVGILVDRGLGLIEKISRSYVSLDVAVIFIGGQDDREALAYAGRVARHPGVKLMVIRFLLETDSVNASIRTGNQRVNNVTEQQEEMKLDDECFAEFYERHVSGGHGAYMEKHLANSAETYVTLRSLEGQYALVIVGRGGRVNSVLTAGMNDWQQCPELGPIGDILSGSEFSLKTSVLIIQQHSVKGELDGLDDDFSVM